MSSILDSINTPADLWAVPVKELPQLAGEIRSRIIEVVTSNGGHLGSNLGTVELTIALHYCYNFEQDRLVWDVGHQAYTHKLLTGRREAFDTLRQESGLSGFPNIAESPFDPFTCGHSGTAISTALGLVCGDAASGRKRRTVACIGDGAMASGMPFEALNHAGHLGKNLLVILNDNEMSIVGTVGALGSYLNRIRTAPAYHELKNDVHKFLDALPVFGERMASVLEHLKETVRRSMVPGRMFQELGFSYYGPVDGHNVKELVNTLNDVKALDGPTLLHVLTQKGRGHPAAEKHPHKMHSAKPKASSNGKVRTGNQSPGSSYTDAFADALVKIARGDKRVAAITAAMPAATAAYSLEFPDRHYNVGICEQHALGLAAGLAAAGLRPVVAIYATFLQRAYDQVFHELCLQNANVVLAVDRAGLVGADGPTHHGAFDVALLRHLPGMTLMAPKDEAELKAMIEFAISTDGPSAIRFPRENSPEPLDPKPIQMGKAEVLRDGSDVVLWAYGAMVKRSLDAAQLLEGQGVSAAVVNTRFAKPMDTDLLEILADRPIVTVSECSLDGGFGSATLEALNRAGRRPNVTRLGIPDRFIQHGPRHRLLELIGLTPRGIAESARRALNLKTEDTASDTNG